MSRLFWLILGSAFLLSCGGTETGNSGTLSSPNDGRVETRSGGGSCAEDLKTCSDGSMVSRDPENSCEFKACPGD